MGNYNGVTATKTERRQRTLKEVTALPASVTLNAANTKCEAQRFRSELRGGDLLSPPALQAERDRAEEAHLRYLQHLVGHLTCHPCMEAATHHPAGHSRRLQSKVFCRPFPKTFSRF